MKQKWMVIAYVYADSREEAITLAAVDVAEGNVEVKEAPPVAGSEVF